MKESLPAGESLNAPESGPPDTPDEAIAVMESVCRELLDRCRLETPSGLTTIAARPGEREPAGLWEVAAVLEGLPDAFEPRELDAVCRAFAEGQDERGVFPSTVRPDGTVDFRPPGADSGSVVALDNAISMVALAWHAMQLDPEPDLLADVAPRLVKGLEALPRNERTHLVSVPVHEADRYVALSFAPGIRMAGDLLYPSLLHVQACQQLADIMQNLGRDGDSDMWRAEAQLVAKRIRMYFWDKGPGLFRAATRQCREHDLWASVHSVFLNVATSGQLVAIARYCKENYDSVVHEGYLRGLPE